MSEVEKWQGKVEEIYTDIYYMEDKMDFYKNELRYLNQRLEEAETMLGEAEYEARKVEK